MNAGDLPTPINSLATGSTASVVTGLGLESFRTPPEESFKAALIPAVMAVWTFSATALAIASAKRGIAWMSGSGSFTVDLGGGNGGGELAFLLEWRRYCLGLLQPPRFSWWHL